MKAHAPMTAYAKGRNFHRIALAMPLAGVASLCTGCSSPLASYDDTYTPASVEENFPIKVVERPVKLTLEAGPGGLQTSDINQLSAFSREAAAHATTPVMVSYTAGSQPAKKAAAQAAGLLARDGVARTSILVTPHDGTGSEVILAFARKVTETKPCGNWTENMAGNMFNESGPNFGCAFQQNFAAMIANPEDLEQPQNTTPPSSAAQSSILDTYYSGGWTKPTSDSTFSGGQ